MPQSLGIFHTGHLEVELPIELFTDNNVGDLWSRSPLGTASELVSHLGYAQDSASSLWLGKGDSMKDGSSFFARSDLHTDTLRPRYTLMVESLLLSRRANLDGGWQTQAGVT